MRSFIKSHRKNDSFSSEISDDFNQNQAKTPTSSQFPYNPQFTPPFQPSTHSRSSPKKLLTPIRNLFSSLGHHSKTNSISSASDRLTDVIQSGPPSALPSKHRSEKDQFNVQGHSSFTNLSRFANKPQEHDEDALSDYIPRNHIDSKSRPSYRISSSSGSLFDDKTSKTSVSQQQSSINSKQDPFTSSIGKNDPSSRYAVDGQLLQPLQMNEETANDSNSSLVDSVENFRTEGVSFLTPKFVRQSLTSEEAHENESAETEDDDDDVSDNSSQFSFVRDKRGGRNTSVKYYKTPHTNLETLNTLNPRDFGFEDDAYSDYDFENNGMDDEDMFDSGGEDEEEVNYNKLFDDDDAPASHPIESHALEPSAVPVFSFQSNYKNHSSSELLWGPLAERHKDDEAKDTSRRKLASLSSNQDSRRIYNKSYHLSIDGFEELDIQSASDLGEDILENYLELPYEPYSQHSIYEATPEPTSSPSLELFDLNSPLINGVTIGNNLFHRFGSIRSDTDGKRLESSANKMFIHRHDSQRLNEHDKARNIATNENKDHSLKKIRAFHGSVDHGLNSALEEKVKEFESFQKKRLELSSKVNNLREETPEPLEHVGLGILPSSVQESNDLSLSFEASGSRNGKDSEVTKPNHQVRSSITQMMDILSGIGQEVAPKNKRESVDDMMKRLAILESNHSEKPDREEKDTRNRNNQMKHTTEPNLFQTKRTVSGKRYSWCESESFHDDEAPSIHIDDENAPMERRNSDEELLDEVNQIPEDYDFESQKGGNNHLSANYLEGAFLRSNSFKKRPLKVMMDYKFANNKIETGRKTVTFYRSNSLNLDISRSRSVSRAPSTRSMRSFVSMNEEPENEEASNNEEKLDDILSRAEKSSLANRPTFKLTVRRDDNFDVERTPSLLGTICESDSPRRSNES